MESSKEEYYVMPSFPTLTVNDLTASSEWYQHVLGFKLVFSIQPPDGKPDAPPLLTHLRWTKYADILLIGETDQMKLPKGKGIGVMLSFAVFDGTVDDLADRAKKRGATIVGGPVTRPWNAREVTIADPDGYLLNFTQQTQVGLSFDHVLHNMQPPIDD